MLSWLGSKLVSQLSLDFFHKLFHLVLSNTRAFTHSMQISETSPLCWWCDDRGKIVNFYSIGRSRVNETKTKFIQPWNPDRLALGENWLQFTDREVFWKALIDRGTEKCHPQFIAIHSLHCGSRLSKKRIFSCNKYLERNMIAFLGGPT